jgi:hypothetical protein
MPLKLKDAKKGSGTLAPAGSHPARCFQIIDMGTHTDDGAFGVQTNRKIRFSWELPDELHVFDEKKGPQPFSVHRMVNFVIAPRSNFQKMLESWRGRAFTEEELENFEIKKVLGATCMITVVHTVKTGATYANVDSVVPLPAKWKAIMAAPVNPPVYYEIEMGKNAIFQSLPEWLRMQISKCNEWADHKPEVGEAPSDEQDPFQGTKDDGADEIPF